MSKTTNKSKTIGKLFLVLNSYLAGRSPNVRAQKEPSDKFKNSLPCASENVTTLLITEDSKYYGIGLETKAIRSDLNGNPSWTHGNQMAFKIGKHTDIANGSGQKIVFW